MTFVYSAQHTGTWFTIRFLEHFFGEVYDFGPLIYDKEFDGYLNLPQNFIHCHMQIKPIIPPDIMAICNQEINRLIDEHKTIIPIRDPMLSLQTKANRGDNREYDLDWIKDIDKIPMLAKHPNVFLFPVDLYKTLEERKYLVENLCDHVGVKDTVYVDEFAKRWQPQNCSILRNVKPCPKAIEWVKKNKSYQKFLRDMGYRLNYFVI